MPKLRKSYLLTRLQRPHPLLGFTSRLGAPFDACLAGAGWLLQILLAAGSFFLAARSLFLRLLSVARDIVARPNMNAVAPSRATCRLCCWPSAIEREGLASDYMELSALNSCLQLPPATLAKSREALGRQ